MFAHPAPLGRWEGWDPTPRPQYCARQIFPLKKPQQKSYFSLKHSENTAEPLPTAATGPATAQDSPTWKETHESRNFVPPGCPSSAISFEISVASWVQGHQRGPVCPSTDRAAAVTRLGDTWRQPAATTCAWPRRFHTAAAGRSVRGGLHDLLKRWLLPTREWRRAPPAPRRPAPREKGSERLQSPSRVVSSWEICASTLTSVELYPSRSLALCLFCLFLVPCLILVNPG